MTTASLLPVEEGDVVLDLCAAPGGKSTELAAKLHGTGLLVTNDISNSRAKALLKNIEVFGVGNALVTSEPPNILAKRFISTCQNRLYLRNYVLMIVNFQPLNMFRFFF